MSPFDQNIDNDAGHTIDQDDLIAFHLHELSPPQERALRRVLQTSPSLQSESIAIATTLRAFPKYEAALPLDSAALDRHWQTLRANLTPHIPPPIAPRTLFPHNIFPRWAFPALAGSALVTTALLVSLHHNQHPSSITVATTQAPTSTATPNPPSIPSNAATPFSPTLIASTQHPETTNRNWPPTPTPLETEIAQTAQPPLSAQLPTPVTPPKSSSTPPGTPATEAAIPPPSNPVQAQLSMQPSPQSPTQLDTSRRTHTFHRSPSTELTLGMFGNITAGRTSSYTSVFGTSQITQTATPAVGALASFRQQFRPWLGYRLTTTYFSPSFNYFNGLNIRHQIYEVSATYVAQGPHHRRLTTSVEAGASVLNFHYRDDYISPTPATTYSTYRAAAVVGVGAEYAISKHWGLRAEYRALAYRPPYVANPGDTSITPTTSLTFSSNPIVGITYRFGAKDND